MSSDMALFFGLSILYSNKSFLLRAYTALY